MSDSEKILEDLIVNDPDEKILFEQYKLYVKMANDVSERRDKTNKFYVTLMSTLVTILSLIYSITKELTILIAPLIIIAIFSKVWMENLNSYKTLNRAKFEIINEIEKELPAKGFTAEWKLVDAYGYTRLTRVEKIVPKIILFLSIISIIAIVLYILIEKGYCFL